MLFLEAVVPSFVKREDNSKLQLNKLQSQNGKLCLDLVFILGYICSVMRLRSLFVRNYEFLPAF